MGFANKLFSHFIYFPPIPLFLSLRSSISFLRIRISESKTLLSPNIFLDQLYTAPFMNCNSHPGRGSIEKLGKLASYLVVTCNGLILEEISVECQEHIFILGDFPQGDPFLAKPPPRGWKYFQPLCNK